MARRTEGDPHDRIVDFERRVRAAVATDVIELPFGQAVATDDLPRVYGQNAIWVHRPAPAQQILDATDDIADRHGWNHRTIEVADPDLADALRSTFANAGYDRDRSITMALTSRPDTDAQHQAVAMVNLSDQLDLSRAIVSEQPWVRSDETADQLVERQQRYDEHIDVRAVVAPSDDPVSRGIVLRRDTTALIDHVGTLSEHRGRGWARAVLDRAICEAFDAGCDLVGLFADADDWPRDWYGRLGFQKVGATSDFRLWPGA